MPRNRFEDSSKAIPACSRLIQAVRGENEIGEFVPHGAPGYPTGVHRFAAEFAARPRRANIAMVMPNSGGKSRRSGDATPGTQSSAARALIYGAGEWESFALP